MYVNIRFKTEMADKLNYRQSVPAAYYPRLQNLVPN